MIRVCKKGNSCGKSCISQSKVCRKNLPPKTQDPLEEKAKAKAKPLEPKAKAKAKVKTPTPISPDTYSKNLIERIKSLPEEKLLVKEFEDLRIEMNRNRDPKKVREEYKKWDKKNFDKLKENPSYLERRLFLVGNEEYLNNKANNTELAKFWKDEREKTQKLIDNLKEKDPKEYYSKKAKEVDLTGVLPGDILTPQEFESLRQSSGRNNPDAAYIREDKQLQHLVYEKRGFNAKPEKGELDGRDDLLTDRSGANLILSRGVKEREAVDDFFEGGRHWIGDGIFGNGTYFAGDYSEPNTTNKGVVAKTVDEYGSNQYRAGIKRDAVVFTGGEKDLNLLEDFLRMRYGTSLHTDLGALMGAIGFDAYLAKQAKHSNYASFQNDIDFFVVLNRGKLVVAKG
jgi:hypothetical protein